MATLEPKETTTSDIFFVESWSGNKSGLKLTDTEVVIENAAGRFCFFGPKPLAIPFNDLLAVQVSSDSEDKSSHDSFLNIPSILPKKSNRGQKVFDVVFDKGVSS